MRLLLASTMHFCTKLYIITLNKAVDAGRPPPDKHHIPPVCCGTHRSLRNNTIYSPLYCGTHRSPLPTPYPTSFVVPKGLPKLTASPSFAVVSTGHFFVAITVNRHMQDFCATCTLVPHCSLIRSVLSLV